MPRLPPVNSLWRDRHFVRLWSAQATGLVAQQFSMFAVPLVAVLTLETDAATVALLTTTFNLPWVILGLFAGVFVDRFRRRSMLIVADLVRAALFVTVPVAALVGLLTVQQMFIMAFAVGILDMCWITAFRSYVPIVVAKRDLPAAYALIGASDGVTRTLAPSLAGCMVQMLNPTFGLGGTALLYASSSVLSASIKRSEVRKTRSEHEPVLKAFRSGLNYAFHQRDVRSIACSESTYLFFWSLMQSLILVLLIRTLGLSASTVGLIFTLGTVGGLIGAASAPHLGKMLGRKRCLLLGSSLRSLGMSMMMLSLISGLAVVPTLIVARLINSFGWTLWDVYSETAIQSEVSDMFRSRVTSSILFLAGTATACGSAVAAGLVIGLGLVPALLIGAAGVLLAVVWLPRVQLSR